MLHVDALFCWPGQILDIPVNKKGGADMGDKGKRDKGKREVQKKAKLTPKEKRKMKKNKPV